MILSYFLDRYPATIELTLEPTLAPTPAWIEHGCWHDDTNPRSLRYGPHAYGYTQQSCYTYCNDGFYRFFALQNGNGNTGWCSCDSNWYHATRYGNAGYCGYTGAFAKNFIYEIRGIFYIFYIFLIFLIIFIIFYIY